MLTDAERKLLTEYLGECWHEWLHIIPEEDDGYYDYTECQKCHEKYSGPHRGSQRTFTTPADLHAVFSKMVEKGKWPKFRRHAEHQYGLIPFIEPITEDEEANFDIDLEEWLFCLACPEQIPERMRMAANFIRGRKD